MEMSQWNPFAQIYANKKYTVGEKKEDFKQDVEIYRNHLGRQFNKPFFNKDYIFTFKISVTE
jgi:hypothetical protein